MVPSIYAVNLLSGEVVGRVSVLSCEETTVSIEDCTNALVIYEEASVLSIGGASVPCM